MTIRAVAICLTLTLAFGATGCSETHTNALASGHNEAYRYADVNPDEPLDVERALAVLAEAASDGDTKLRRDLAKYTLERITDGDVLIGSIRGARGLDRWHMCKDYDLAACQGAPTDDDHWVGDDEVAETLERDLDGYMWGNRLYFAARSDMTVNELASTLVHEVNHVLNRSECNYYHDIDAHVVDGTRAFIEEYRAFFGECFYANEHTADLTTCDAMAFEHVLEYELDFDLTTVLPGGADDSEQLGKLILSPPEQPTQHFGLLVPETSSWPSHFGTCDPAGAH